MTIYSDTIKIIEEMLKEEGMEGKFRDILYKKIFSQNHFFINLLDIQKIFFYIMRTLRKIVISMNDCKI